MAKKIYTVTFEVYNVEAEDEEEASTLAAERVVVWDEPINVRIEED